MPKFLVKVTVKSECTYEVEVEEPSEGRAEDVASAQWRNKLPDDYQVEKGYITDWECETVQLTWECVECEKPITEEQNRKYDEMCPSCYTAQALGRAS